MDTVTKTPRIKRSDVLHYIVIKGGKSCILATYGRFQILVPSPFARMFATRRQACRAVNRSKRFAHTVYSSHIGEWLVEKHPELKVLVNPDDFEIVPVLKPAA
ncbi:MAG TPA: hypothetical protein VEA41_00040 [Salinarimonas sp.]|nr:hypothetical protein [Salinarimonas sp.]